MNNTKLYNNLFSFILNKKFKNEQITKDNRNIKEKI